MKCTWKNVYYEKKFAKKIKRLMEKQKWTKITVYKCDECGHFHLSSCDKEYLSNLREWIYG